MTAEDMLALTDQAAEAFPELPDFYAEKGVILTSAGRLRDAALFFEHTFALSVQQDGMRDWQASRSWQAPVVWRHR